MTTLLTAISGIITGVFGLAKLVSGWFTKTDAQKVQDINNQVNQEETSFEKDGRPHE